MHHENGIADFFFKWDTETLTNMSDETISLALKASKCFWNFLDSRPEPEIQESDFLGNEALGSKSTDWISEAINHPGGKIAEFWIRLLLRKYKHPKEAWNGIPNDYSEFFNSILGGNSKTGQLGRVIFARQLGFFFSLDQEWTERKFFPLFDWTQSSENASQAWYGYLGWGIGPESLLERLLSIYPQTFSHLGNELTGVRNNLADYLAYLAVSVSNEGFKLKIIREFIKNSQAEDRAKFAGQVGWQLKELNGENQIALWNKSLKDYWGKRNMGLPYPIAEAELLEMVKWIPRLKAVFDEAVALVCNVSPPTCQDHFLYTEIRENNLALTHGPSLIQLLLHLLPNTTQDYLVCEDLEGIVKDLIQTNQNKTDLLQIVDKLAHLGCSCAMGLKKQIEEN